MELSCPSPSSIKSQYNTPTKALLLLLISLFAVQAQAQFLTPPSNDPPPANKFDSGEKYTRFSVLRVEWECDYPAWRLWVYPNDGGAENLRTQFIDSGPGARNGLQKYTYNWTVDTPYDYSTYQFYFKIERREGGGLTDGEIFSKLFTITDSLAGTNSTSLAAAARSTITMTVTATPSADRGQGNELSKETKIGLSVGFTIGSLFILGIGVFLGRRSVSAFKLIPNRRNDRNSTQTPIQDLSSLDPKWQKWIARNVGGGEEEGERLERPVAHEVNGQSMFPAQVELRADERRERHELAEREFGRWRGVEYGYR